MKIKKKTTKKKSPPKKETSRLQNPKWELFCQYYAKNTATFGNAKQSYAKAYGYNLDSLSTEAVVEEYEDNGRMRTRKVDDSPYDKSSNVCAVEGNRLLSIPNVNARIDKLLFSSLTDEFVDTERAYVIKQRENLAAKNSAMRDFDKVRGRIIDHVIVDTVPIDSKTKNKSDDALAEYLNGLHKQNSTKQ
jgi:hypothetical protein